MVDRSDLEAVFGVGPWLVVCPHDDDLVLGMGMVLSQARNIEVHVAVVTDGAMGYDEVSQQANVVQRRQAELVRALQKLGIDDQRLHRLGFPDGALTQHQGCRPPGQPPGVAQSLVGLMRRVRPTTVWTCAPSDYHPDHRTTASEVDIASFWAANRIWLELGEPVERPARWDYAVYCAFDGPPHVEVRGDDATLQTKLDALAAFKSQGVIEGLVEQLQADGPVEYFRRTTLSAYRPSRYAPLFE